MIKNLKDNKNCSQDEQASRFDFVTKKYGLKDKASLFLTLSSASLRKCMVDLWFILRRNRAIP